MWRKIFFENNSGCIFFVVKIDFRKFLSARVFHLSISGEMTSEDAAEDSGWRLVHGDVFRAPPRPSLLAVTLGTGMQILCMVVFLVLLAAFGFISPLLRGAVLQGSLILIACTGGVAGEER
jgi:hypothetical protein